MCQPPCIGLPPFHGVYLPWLYLTFSLLLGTNPIPDLMGIAAGHVYYFLQVPQHSHRRSPCAPTTCRMPRARNAVH